jgi:hypothetical protein
VGRNARGGEMSMGRIFCGMKCAWGEISTGQSVHGARYLGGKCPWGQML